MSKEKKPQAFNPKVAIATYLIPAQQEIKLLTGPLAQMKTNLLKNENVLFHDDIQKEYDDAIKSMIAHHLVKAHIGVNIEEAYETLEDVNLGEYLK